MQAPEICYRAPTDLIPYARNPRKHSRKQIQQIAESIRIFGWTNPVLLDGEGGIIAGHGRVEAAKLLGLDQVPTLRIDHLNEAQKRAYILADNRLAEKAGWDRELLALELQGLNDLDLGFDLTITGFEAGEIDVLIGELTTEPWKDPAEEDVAPDLSKPPVNQPGELWCLGEHRLLCGDATDSGSYERLLGADRAQMVFTDPPYNVPVDGHVCGLGKTKHRDFAMASGEMSEAEFTDFLTTVFSNLVAASCDGSIHFVCMDWRHVAELLAAGKPVYSDLNNLCVWAKTNGGMGSLYRSQHELVFVFKAGNAPHINNVELGTHGRYRTNLWHYAGVNSFGKDRDEQLAAHPTVKPVALVADAILDCSKRGGIVLDAFAGSGTTIVAAEKTGRRGYGIEIDPLYVDTAIERWQTFTGRCSVHAETDMSFDQMTQERNKAAAGEKETADV